MGFLFTSFLILTNLGCLKRLWFKQKFYKRIVKINTSLPFDKKISNDNKTVSYEKLKLPVYKELILILIISFNYMLFIYLHKNIVKYNKKIIINMTNSKIKNSHIFKYMVLRDELNKINVIFNILYSFTFFLIPINIALLITFFNNINFILLIFAIIFPFIYCLLMPILLYYSLIDNDETYKRYNDLIRLLKKEKNIEKIMQFSKFDLDFYFLIIKYIIKDIQRKKFVNYFTSAYLMMSIILTILSFLNCFNIL